MTLILYMANRDFAVQISDRRLTSSRGLETDESGKAAILTTSDARFSVGFTGLAGWGSYETQFAIIDHLSKLGKLGVHSSRPLALRLAEWMSQDFRRLAASREDKRTSILWLGYRYVGRETPDPRISVGLISNFEDLSGRRLDLATDDFQVDLQSEPVGDGTATATMTYATAIGTTGGLLDDDLASLRRLLFRRPTSRSVENLGARAVRRAAQASRSGGVVGEQLMITTVFSSLKREPEGRFSTAVPSKALYFPDQVVVRPGNFGVRFQLRVETADEDDGPLLVQSVPRNQPCPCGSQRRYKHCHGKFDKRKSPPGRVVPEPLE